MSKEVKRYCLGEFAEPHTYPIGPGSHVLASDYDALLAERDAAQKDADRLAWLIGNGVQVTSVGGDPIRLTREVIDAALQGAQP